MDRQNNRLYLPMEVLGIIFDYVSFKDLCRCACVCKYWNDVVCGLDQTTWKRLFLSSHEWKHPNFPLNEDEPDTPWKELYKYHFCSTKLWCTTPSPTSVTCLYVFKRKKERKIIHVGTGNYEFESIRMAINFASDYDKIMLHPGVYDEQFELGPKSHLEIIGCGYLGTVILISCIEHASVSTRLCNLVLRAPWFTGHMLKIKSGHLQIDNCRFEDGQILIQSPASCLIRYSTFMKAHLALHHINNCVIENCYFSCDNTAIQIQGPPKRGDYFSYYGIIKFGYLRLYNGKSIFNVVDDNNISLDDCDNLSISAIDKNSSCIKLKKASVENNYELSNSKCSQPEFCLGIGAGASAAAASCFIGSQADWDCDTVLDSDSDCSYSTDTDFEGDSKMASLISNNKGHVANNKSERNCSDLSSAIDLNISKEYIKLGFQNDLHTLLKNDIKFKLMIKDTVGPIIRNCVIENGQGGISVTVHSQAHIRNNRFNNLSFAIRCLQNSKALILGNEIKNCRSSGIFMRLHSTGLIAGNNISETSEAAIDIRRNADPIIILNKIHHSKRSGIVVLGSGKGTIKSNDIYNNKEAAIYILFKGNPYIADNRIYDGLANGIAVSQDGRGFILNNLINNNQWNGIDVRSGGEPRIVSNLISSNHCHGIVIGRKSSSTSIENNFIYSNYGSGIVLCCGTPRIQGNQIESNGEYGLVFMQSTTQVEMEGGNQMASSSSSADEDDDDSTSSDSSGENLYCNRRMNSACNTMTLTGEKILTSSVQYNNISYNHQGGVRVKRSDCEIRLLCNKIHANRGIGCFIEATSSVLINTSSITCNGSSGVVVEEDGKLDIIGCGLYDNCCHGLDIGGSAKINDNDIFNNQMNGIYLRSNSKAVIEDNRLHSTHDYALALDQGASGNVKYNLLVKGRYQELCVVTTSITNGFIFDNNCIREPPPCPTTEWECYFNDPPPRPHLCSPKTISPVAPARWKSSFCTIKNYNQQSLHRSTVCSIL